ncbi:hypothetical protein DFH06DRAFT_991016, partial [Mycena polygramma]
MITLLPEPCKTLLKTASDFNIRLDALNIDDEVKRGLPIWFHPAASKELNYLNNSLSSKCLRNIHKVSSVGDLMAITTGESPRHSRRKNCACAACKHDRARGCIKPYACRDEGIKLLDCLHPKWDPRHLICQPNPALTVDELLINQNEYSDNKAVTFDPNITLSNFAHGFRVFVNKPRSKKPADQLPHANNVQNTELTVYAGGSFKINTEGDPCAGGGAWFSENSPKN